jgi:iron complex transport system ATP-binding protein
MVAVAGSATDMTETTVLSLRDVAIERGNQRLMTDLSLSLAAGEILGVLGPNGAGKTSLLSACSGEMALAAGQVRCAGQLVAAATARKLARVRAVLPQQSMLTFNLPIRQIIEMGAYPFAEIEAHQVQGWAEQAIADGDLSQHLYKRYDELSGGEQQRVQYARVFVQTHAIAHVNGHACLFLDEPTASLDLKHQSLVVRSVRQIARENIAGVFVILHDLSLAARLCDKLLLLSPRFTPVYGTPETVLQEATLAQVYGVQMSVLPNPRRPKELWVMPND